MDTHIQQVANEARYMNEIWLNVQLTGWERDAGYPPIHTLDLIDTNKKFRALGVID